MSTLKFRDRLYAPNSSKFHHFPFIAAEPRCQPFLIKMAEKEAGVVALPTAAEGRRQGRRPQEHPVARAFPPAWATPERRGLQPSSSLSHKAAEPRRARLHGFREQHRQAALSEVPGSPGTARSPPIKGWLCALSSAASSWQHLNATPLSTYGIRPVNPLCQSRVSQDKLGRSPHEMHNCKSFWHHC